jgi:8-oxo-dGTP pyrophosphatase MutT (NUDIX family)
MSTEPRAEPRLGARGRDRTGPFERETSYGGVVVRADDVLVITPRGKPVTGLPKGGAAAGETGAEAALREVREETGVQARVLEPLGDVRYWYRRGGRRVHKTVHFYLCEFLTGSTADHDHEVDEARWIPLQEARKALSYGGERALIERALSKLAAGR